MLGNILLTTIKIDPRGSARIRNHVESSEVEVHDNFSTGPGEEDNTSQCASGFMSFLS